MLDEEERLVELRMAEVWNDRGALRALDVYLIERTEPWVRKLRLKIGLRASQLRNTASAQRPAGADFTSRYGLSSPSGQWLYRYRLKDSAFRQMEQDVRAAAQGARLDTGTMPALFVLWASEWFRRSYRGDGHRWESLSTLR